MADDKGQDDKILSVAASDPNYMHVNTLADLPPHLLRELEHFFLTYKNLESKDVRSDGGKQGGGPAVSSSSASRLTGINPGTRRLHGPDLFRPRRHPGGPAPGHAPQRPLTCESSACPALPWSRWRHVGFGPAELFAGWPIQAPGGGPGTLLGHFAETASSCTGSMTGSCSCSPGSSTRATSSTCHGQAGALRPAGAAPVRRAPAFDEVFGSGLKAPWRTKDEVWPSARAGILKPGGFIVGDRAEDMAVAGPTV